MVPGETKIAQIQSFCPLPFFEKKKLSNRMLGHHDVGSEDWLQRRRKSPPVCETHLTAGKQGVERLGGGKL